MRLTLWRAGGCRLQVEVEIPPGVLPGDTFLVEVAGAEEAQQQAQMQMQMQQHLSKGSPASGNSSGHNFSTGVLGDASQLLGMSGLSSSYAPSVEGGGAPPLSPEDSHLLSFGLGSSDLDSSLASTSSCASPRQNASDARAPVVYDGMIGLHTVFEYAEGGMTHAVYCISPL